jgi:hypothetical protein
VHLVHFTWLCDKLHVQSSDPRTGVAHAEYSRARRIRTGRLRDSIGKSGVLQRSWHSASKWIGPPRIWGGASSPVQVRLRCARWDTRGTGDPSPRRRTPQLSLGSYN